MSRPSRGFTVTHPQPTSHPTCPAASTITLFDNSPDDWQVETDWVPAVNVGTLSLYASVNGGAFTLLDVGNNVDSGYTFEFNPSASGDPGDEMRLRVDATDVGGCPDFFSNVITHTIG